MGVLGWPPSVVMQEADIEDLSDAYEGYAQMNGFDELQASYPSVQFLDDMMEKFPDME